MESQLHYGAAAKPIGKASLQRIGWTVFATSALSFLLVVLNRIHPSPALRWTLIAIFLVQGYWIFYLAGRVGKPKSVLPPEMEASRLRIANEHNLLCGLLLFALLAIWIIVAVVRPHHRLILWVAVAATVLIEGFGLCLIFQHDTTLCRRLGYLCPLCHKPLYEPRSPTFLTGLCPKCKRSILSKGPVTALSSSFTQT